MPRRFLERAASSAQPTCERAELFLNAVVEKGRPDYFLDAGVLKALCALDGLDYLMFVRKGPGMATLDEWRAWKSKSVFHLLAHGP